MPLTKVKFFDYDNYICALLAPKSLWNDIATILEFNIEIASIKNKVTEASLGLVRIAWWIESIEEFYSSGKMKRHENLTKLAEIIKKYSIPKELFINLLNARIKDFEDVPFTNLNDLIFYAKNTAANLSEAIFLINSSQVNCNIETYHKIKDAVENFSIAWAITAMIRAYKVNAKNGRIIIPEEVTLNQLLEKAEFFIAKGRGFIENLDKKILRKYSNLLIKARLAEFYIKQMKYKDYNFRDKEKYRYIKGQAIKPYQIKSVEGFGAAKLTLYNLLGWF
ncbi:MAG: squalene/phytoene synthase family protein [Rickettsiales bacterium]|nr:squalene/phytoene synthase family protein [Rickettsiales bacterium]